MEWKEGVSIIPNRHTDDAIILTSILWKGCPNTYERMTRGLPLPSDTRTHKTLAEEYPKMKCLGGGRSLAFAECHKMKTFPQQAKENMFKISREN